MAKNEWGKNIIILLMGVIFGNLLSQNEPTQKFLFQYLPSQWRLPMGILILFVVLIGLMIWYWRLEVKNFKEDKTKESKLEAKLDKIAKEIKDEINNNKTVDRP